MTIKFSGLVDIVDGIVDGDLFALSDVSASQTKSITFASLKTSIWTPLLLMRMDLIFH